MTTIKLKNLPWARKKSEKEMFILIVVFGYKIMIFFLFFLYFLIFQMFMSDHVLI